MLLTNHNNRCDILVEHLYHKFFEEFLSQRKRNQQFVRTHRVEMFTSDTSKINSRQ